MNEKLIKDVFRKMAEYKPALQKYLIADEPDEEVMRSRPTRLARPVRARAPSEGHFAPFARRSGSDIDAAFINLKIK